MRRWLTLCNVVFLSILLLVAVLSTLITPSQAAGASLGGDVSIQPRALPGALHLGQATASRSKVYDVMESMSAGAVATVTYSTDIWPGEPMVMGSTDTILEFAPGASDWKVATVTFIPTAPQNPPPNGSIPRTWEITTTASSYEVTATFMYGPKPPDIALVLDQSGSMEWHTLCYGCWAPVPGVDYPGGNIYPLPWAGAADWDVGDPYPPEHCGPTSYLSDDGYDYYFIEAEEYSYTSNSYDRDFYVAGYTYWVLQRTGGWGNTYASGRDSGVSGGGAYIMHMPYPDMQQGGPGATCRYEEVAVDVDPPDGLSDGKCWSGAPGGPYDAPRVDYNFAPIENRPDGYYIWVRGQAPNTGARWDGLDRRLFWGIDGVVGGSEGRSGNCGVGCVTNFRRGTGYGGASNNWEWRRLNDNGPIYWAQDVNRTLNIWAGGAEFALDRIVITNDPSGYAYLEPLQANSGRGTQVWANGRSGWACDRCDARFAGYPDRVYELSDPSDVVDYFPICDIGPNPDRRTDDIYDGEQYMTGAVEAAKRFVGMLDPSYDQVGYVRFSSSAGIASELQCRRRLGDNCTRDVISDTVVVALEEAAAGGSTNIADGMLKGLAVLSVGYQWDCELGTGHCGRPDAAHVMILMTDGVPNQRPNDYCDDEDLWPDQPGESDAERRAKDCVMYYAYEARDQGVIVDTVTLGLAADLELMQAVADLTGGVHRNANTPEELDPIFAELYELHHPPPPASRARAIYHRDTSTDTWTLHPLTMTQYSTATWAVTGTGITALSEWTLGYLPPHQVTLEAAPGTLPADGLSTAVLTATVTDVDHDPVPEDTIVTFIASLGRISRCDDDPGSVVLPLGTNANGIVTACLTAGLEPGLAAVTATAGVATGITSVEFTQLLVELEAVPSTLPADGLSTAVLTATVTDVYSQLVHDGTIVTFATSLGRISRCDDGPGSVNLPLGTNANGVVTACLTAGLEPGLAVVTATAGVATGITSVEFTQLLVELEAAPDTLPADGLSNAVLTATVTDIHTGKPVHDGTIVTFATSLGSVFPPTSTTGGGVATAVLTAGIEPGSAVVTATAGKQFGAAQVRFESFLYLPLVLHNHWAIPGEEPGTASIGGLLWVMVGDTPEIMTGVDVEAYSQGGAVYRTRSSHDGTYYFYNIPPGTYIIHAEAWVGNSRVVGSAAVTVVSDERNYWVNLLLK